MTPAPVATRLPRGVRIGYGSGSVATGAFGTVPGLMLLPYLTDELGIAALWAGAIVFLPKAWDVVLNPIAGRVSDRTVDPAGPRRPWLIRAGLMLAGAFALIFAAPELGSSLLEAGWVLVFFVLAASAYAFFQVPYVAMPAEITSSYDERTRLMTWRLVGASAAGDLELPTRMAEVNAMLDVASPAMREALLVAFLDRLQRPVRTSP